MRDLDDLRSGPFCCDTINFGERRLLANMTLPDTAYTCVDVESRMLPFIVTTGIWKLELVTVHLEARMNRGSYFFCAEALLAPQRPEAFRATIKKHLYLGITGLYSWCSMPSMQNR